MTDRRHIRIQTAHHGTGPAAVPSPPAWMVGAPCSTVDPDLWFPEKGESAADAKRVCLRCDLRRTCLEWALETDQQYGVWGAASETDRRRLKRGIAPKPPGRCLHCGGEIASGRGARLYCAATCRNAAYRARRADAS